MRVHYQRLTADCPVPSSASPSAKHEKKKAGPGTYNPPENNFVVGVGPENKDIMSIAVSKCGNDGIDGNLCQKDMHLLKLSRAKYYRDSGVFNARKLIEIWNSGVKEHLEAISNVTLRGVYFRVFPEFMETQAAHYEELRKEYTKPRWARQRMNLYRLKQHALADFLNLLTALKEDKSQRLLLAHGAGNWASKKGSIRALSARADMECALRFVTISIHEFRIAYVLDGLECTLQKVDMDRSQPSVSETEKSGERTEEQMERRARVRGILAYLSTASGNAGKSR
jgi:hypothetical protein